MWSYGSFVKTHEISHWRSVHFSLSLAICTSTSVSRTVVSDFVTPWTVVCQVPLSMEFSRQEYCSDLMFPSPGDIPNPGIKPTSPAWQANSLPLSHWETPNKSFSSVQFSRSVVSDSLRPHELQHARPPCPSPTPGVYPNSRPLNRWCHPTISSSVIPVSSCPQSFPASGSFPMNQLFISGGQSIGDSPSVLPMNIQGWFPLGLTGLVSLLSKGL